MKLRYLYSIMCIFSLLALPGCREEEAVQTSEGTRTVTVNLGIAMSRAEKVVILATELLKKCKSGYSKVEQIIV